MGRAEEPRQVGPVVTISKQEPTKCAGKPLYSVRLCHTNAADTRDEHIFQFDRAYGGESSQEDVYSESIRPQVQQVLQGGRCSVLAYGATGSGKTYTMLAGTEGEEEAHEGIVMRWVSLPGCRTTTAK